MPTNATMGVTVLASGGGAYSTGTFDNLKYTTTDGSTFSTTTAPSLVSAEAKAAAYYPWASGTDITAVPVTTAAQTDYMYSGWYTGLKDSNPQAKFNMKHALAAVRIGVQKSAGYTPTATLTAVSATSDAFYASATLDATSSTGTLSGLTGPGAVLENTSLNQALSTSPYTTDFLVVPGTSAQTITFTVTIGGSEYTATTAAVTLQQGAIHSYTLTLSAEGLAVTGTTVEPWTTIDKGDLTLVEKYFTFTIDGTEYKAEKGWDWYTWINSELNVDNFSTAGFNVNNSLGEIVATDTGTIVLPYEFIMKHNYTIVSD